mmetsp:Transcript_31990/g.94137  ORF Transcript_31990/g.94137 Transcript_31990/m.94137 type:complete len:340 (+) Transcript_31990:652-1671(+)
MTRHLDLPVDGLLEGIGQDEAQGRPHGLGEVVQIMLQLPLHAEWFRQLHLFAILGNHGIDRIAAASAVLQLDEAEIGQSIVTIAEVPRDLGGVRTIRQHVQERHRRYEVKAGEDLLLHVQVLVERLLAQLQLLSHPTEQIKSTRHRADVHDLGLGIDGGILHELLKIRIDGLKSLGVLRKLRSDIGRSQKDRLQRRPKPRYHQPHGERFVDGPEQRLPQHDTILEMVHELAHPIDALQLHLMGLDGFYYLLRGTGQGDVGIAVREVLQLHLPPNRVDLRQLPLDLDLLGGCFDDVFDLFLVLVEAETEQIIQDEPIVGGRIDRLDVANPGKSRPMPGTD